MPAARFRLICFPCAGGSAPSYTPWQADLPPDIEGFALQMPGRSDRFRDAPISDLRTLIREIATAVRPLLDRPAIFFGHSLGALLSFELVRELRRQRAPLPVRLWVAGRGAPQVPDRDSPIAHLPDAEFIEKLRSLGGIPDEILDHQELLELVLPVIRADMLLHEKYGYYDEAPLSCPIIALGGRQDREVLPEDLEAWAPQTCSQFEVHWFDGGHFFVHAERKRIAALISKSLVGLNTA
jgi:medium-chain acyl-[acyl-carrier-protein] hydrolase